MSINIIVIIILILFKAVFSASDTAFTYLNRSKINQMAKSGNKKAIKIRQMMQKPNNFFATIKVGITFLEFISSAYAAEAFLNRISVGLNFLNADKGQIDLLAVLILTVILSYFMLVFGDMIPKNIARNNPEKTTFLVITPLVILSKIIYPFEVILNASLKFFLKILNIKDESNEKLTERELKMIISEGKDIGIMDAYVRRIMLNTLKFDDIYIKDIMTPRDKAQFIDINLSQKQIMSSLKKYKYTRVPVYKEKIDNIIGILNIKDIILKYEKNNISEIKFESMLRKPFFVDKDDKVDEAFKIMQLNAHAIAIVKSENKIVGIVTIEDMLEKIVGDIFDEYDRVN